MFHFLGNCKHSVYLIDTDIKSLFVLLCIIIISLFIIEFTSDLLLGEQKRAKTPRHLHT